MCGGSEVREAEETGAEFKRRSSSDLLQLKVVFTLVGQSFKSGSCHRVSHFVKKHLKGFGGKDSFKGAVQHSLRYTHHQCCWQEPDEKVSVSVVSVTMKLKPSKVSVSIVVYLVCLNLGRSLNTGERSHEAFTFNFFSISCHSFHLGFMSSFIRASA